MGQRVNKNRRKRNELMQIVIMFLFFGIITVVSSSILAVKIFQNSGRQDKSKTENPKEILSDNSATDSNIANKENSEDVAYLEKYLTQQVMGKMPDGADGKKVVYLTFDDGPSTTVTPYVLNTLKRENVQATFFVLGESIDKSDEAKNILKRQVNEGHAIGNHTYSHNYDYLYPNGIISTTNFINDIEKTNKSLKNVLGNDFSTRVIRFPGGYTSWKDLNNTAEYLRSRGYYFIEWNSLSKDSEGGSKSAPELINEIKQSVQGREKAVILMHDNYGKEETAKALPEIIQYLKQQGYEFKTIK